MQRPTSEEYNNYYAGYVNLVPDGNIVANLMVQSQSSLNFYQSIPDTKGSYAYADGKWTVKELLIHLLDAERVFAYRALRIARGDVTPLAGFDQDAYIPTSVAGTRSLTSIIDEYQATRASTIAMIKQFSPEMFARIGNASGTTISAKALAFIIAGHELHHIAILKEKYLS